MLNEQQENTKRPHLVKFHWPAGVSGNPSGRPKGSRNKLSEDFLAALQEDFEKHGSGAIKECRETDPSGYVKIVASILPKEFVIERATDGLTDAQLAAALEFIRSCLSGGDGQGAGSGTTIEGIAEQASELQTIQETT